MSNSATVLVVDDEQEVADVYSLRLQSEYTVKTAYGGTQALEKIDEDIDVVLLDRRMPDLSGDDVLDELESSDLNPRVIMLTAVDPDFDILDMGFDDYLRKPVDKDDLVSAIEQQLSAQRYDERVEKYLELSSKLALLEDEKSAHELDDNAEVAELRKRVDALGAEIDESVSEIDDFDAAFRDL
ncbi:MAG: response regulator [Haloarculaceae archaeon]